MKKTPPPRWAPFLGLIYWGDLAQTTTYRDKRGRIIWFPKTYPKDPPTPAQLACRQTMKDAAQSWHSLTQQQRQAYAQAINKLSLTMSPFSLHFTLSLPHKRHYKRTIEQQSGVKLP